MRTALSVAALAAGALAVPYKRDVVYTDYDIVYVTDVITVTAGQAPAAYTSASASPSEVSIAQHYGHHAHSQESSTLVWVSTVTEEASTPTSTSTPAPAYTPVSSTPEPSTSSTPAPEPMTISSSSAYEIPLTTYVPLPSSSYVAPSSSQAPASIASASYGSSPYSGDSEYAQIAVNHHNLHRANHSVDDIAWDENLASIAASIASTCVYKHNTTAGGGGYGQNIAAGVDAANISAVITDMFYNGEEWQFADAGLYGQANPDMSNFEAWGHFTQIVWKSTTTVGCWTQECSTLYDSDGNAMSDLIQPYFTVCNYQDPGNFGGEYADNVLKPVGKSIAQWDTGLS